VAAEVARELDAPLDILVVRKIGHPMHEEFAIGAIASGGVTVMNAEQHDAMGEVRRADVDRIVAREQAELRRREVLYRGNHPAVPLEGREAILVDDGLATGATMRAAVQAVRQPGPARVTVAVPRGGPQAAGRGAEAPGGVGPRRGDAAEYAVPTPARRHDQLPAPPHLR
jgi:predicted phosphoribosyltransferase